MKLSTTIKIKFYSLIYKISHRVFNWCLENHPASAPTKYITVPEKMYINLLNENEAYEISYTNQIHQIALLKEEVKHLTEIINERALIEEAMINKRKKNKNTILMSDVPGRVYKAKERRL